MPPNYIIEALARNRVRALLRERLSPRADELLQFVVPLFNLERGSKPIVAGCAAKVVVNGAKFLFTAAHVIDRLLEAPIHAMDYEGGFVQLTGESSYSEPPAGVPREEDRIDAGVLRLDESSSAAVRGPFLSIRDLDINEENRANHLLIAGYPSSRLKKDFERRKLIPRPLRYAATRRTVDTSMPSGIADDSHVVLDFDRDAVLDGNGGVMTAPAPDGMSGCGVWAWHSLLRPGSVGRDKLIAIFTDHWDTHDMMVATRVGVHTHLLKSHWPDVGRNIPESRRLRIRSRKLTSEGPEA